MKVDVLQEVIFLYLSTLHSAVDDGLPVMTVMNYEREVRETFTGIKLRNSYSKNFSNVS